MQNAGDDIEQGIVFGTWCVTAGAIGDYPQTIGLWFMGLCLGIGVCENQGKMNKLLWDTDWTFNESVMDQVFSIC